MTAAPTAEDRVRAALDAVTAPAGLKEATLAAIAAEARARGESAFDEAPTAIGLAGGKAPSAVGPAGGKASTAPPTPVPNRPPTPDTAPRAAHRTSRPSYRFLVRLAAAAAACLVVVVAGIGGWRAYATETAVISIEVNPAIELGINRFGTVVAARALNDDGRAVLDAIAEQGERLVGMGGADAVATVAESDALSPYAASGAYLAISVVCDDDAQAASLVASCDAAIAASPLHGSCGRATFADHEEAHHAGMGVARYEAACELMRVDPTVAIEDCRELSLRELLDRILAVDPDNAFALDRSASDGLDGEAADGAEHHGGHDSGHETE